MDMSGFQKDIAELGAALAEGLEAQVFGSWSKRNPAAGKMMTCPFCRARRREFAAERCCNAAHTSTKRAWDEEQGFHQVACSPRVNEQPFSKSVIKKMLHKRHGQNKNWHRRMLTSLLQSDVHLLESAACRMYSRPCLKKADILKMVPAAEGIPAFAEQYYNWLQLQKRLKQRGQA